MDNEQWARDIATYDNIISQFDLAERRNWLSLLTARDAGRICYQPWKWLEPIVDVIPPAINETCDRCGVQATTQLHGLWFCGHHARQYGKPGSILREGG